MLSVLPKTNADMRDAIWFDLFSPTEEEIAEVEKRTGVTLPRRDATRRRMQTAARSVTTAGSATDPRSGRHNPTRVTFRRRSSSITGTERLFDRKYLAIAKTLSRRPPSWLAAAS